MYDENSVCPKIETGYDFKPSMIDVLVKDFTESFFQDGNDSAVFRKNNYTRLMLYFNIYQVQKKLKNIEVSRTKFGVIIDTLTSIDICEIVKIGGKVIKK